MFSLAYRGGGGGGVINILRLRRVEKGGGLKGVNQREFR